MALGGGFDLFEEIDRSQYFAPSEKYATLLEHALRYGNAYQNQKAEAKHSLFGDSDEVLIPEPKIPECEPWPLIERLNREKEVTGIYISGHPLDPHKLTIENFTTCSLPNIENRQGNLNVAGMVIKADHKISQAGTGYGFFTVQDYEGSLEFALFKEEYIKFKHYMEIGQLIYLKGNMRFNHRAQANRFNVSSIRLLEGVAEEMTNSITLKINLAKVDESFIADLETICYHNKGNHKLKLFIVDAKNNVILPTSSANYKVNVQGTFIKEMNRLGIDYKLNV